MLFSSPSFFAFFALYFIGHLLVPLRYRIFYIILASTAFYMFWNPKYVFIPYLLAGMGFYGVRWMETSSDNATKQFKLAVLLICLLTPLFFYKYTGFFLGTVARYPLPLGISFITFTIIAYIVDVYRGKFKSETHVRHFLGSVLFFPHLIAGPIVTMRLTRRLDDPKRFPPNGI